MSALVGAAVGFVCFMLGFAIGCKTGMWAAEDRGDQFSVIARSFDEIRSELARPDGWLSGDEVLLLRSAYDNAQQAKREKISGTNTEPEKA